MSGAILVELVDVGGQALGTCEKLAAHQNGGSLHRAVSVMLVNEDGLVLLQKRAPDKYHFRSLWANACCSHPQPGETPKQAAERAMKEELGLASSIDEVGTMVYAAQDPETGLWEREYDHVFVGTCRQALVPNPEHVSAVKWVAPKRLKEAIDESPGSFAPWLTEVLRASGLASSDE